MNTSSKPIAHPKKGMVKSSGHFVAVKSSRKGNTTVVHAHGTKKKGATSKESWVHKVTGVPSANHRLLLARVENGLAFSAIATLEEAYHATRKAVAEVLSIRPSTLTRRQQTGRLSVEESDRVVRLARLKDQALALTQGDEEAAIAWLHTPQKIFDGDTPMAHARTELGARDVEKLIMRLRHGVFS